MSWIKSDVCGRLRAPGTLTGRTALEAFVDGRVEELITTAGAGGSASGEFRLSGAEGPVLVGVAGQLDAADPTAGHGQRLGPAQASVQVDRDVTAHRRPPPRVA